MELVVVIMAGGVGARFWPRSRVKEPKQLLKIFNNNSMIQDTVDRLKGLVKNENIFIITNKIQKELIVKQLPKIPKENIIEEPFGKNTAACVGLANVIIESKFEEAIVVVLPADHLIKNVKEFKKTVKEAAKFAETNDCLITFGINPTRPETGYGYIQIDENAINKVFHKVLTFAEKPNLATAKRFIKSGDFFWNSGMFIWRTNIIMNEINEYMPELYDGLQTIKKSVKSTKFNNVVKNVYGQLRNISIDYGIMEHSKKVFLIKGTFDWSDVGSWDTVYDLSKKDKNNNVNVGNVYTANTSRSYVYSPDKFTAVLGVDDLLIINTDDATLVCHRNYAQDVKLVVEHLKMNKKKELL